MCNLEEVYQSAPLKQLTLSTKRRMASPFKTSNPTITQLALASTQLTPQSQVHQMVSLTNKPCKTNSLRSNASSTRMRTNTAKTKCYKLSWAGPPNNEIITLAPVWITTSRLKEFKGLVCHRLIKRKDNRRKRFDIIRRFMGAEQQRGSYTCRKSIFFKRRRTMGSALTCELTFSFYFSQCISTQI